MKLRRADRVWRTPSIRDIMVVVPFSEDNQLYEPFFGGRRLRRLFVHDTYQIRHESLISSGAALKGNSVVYLVYLV